MIVGKKKLKSAVPKTKENNGKRSTAVSQKKMAKITERATGGRKISKVAGQKSKSILSYEE